MGGSAEAAHSFSAASLFLPHRQRYKATIHRGAHRRLCDYGPSQLVLFGVAVIVLLVFMWTHVH